MPGRIQSIERASAILRVISGRSRVVGVVELADEVGLPKATVHGILRTLQHIGFVERDPGSGKYRLGAATLHMGSTYLQGSELRTRALTSSDSLAAQTQEAVRLGTLHEGRVLILHHVARPGDRLQTLDVGSLLPAHATALGKVLLGSRPHIADELLEDLPRYTTLTITEASALRRELECVRNRGWAAEAGELELLLSSIAAPITDRNGRTVGAIGIVGPPDRLFSSELPRPELVTHVREHARAVSHKLGGVPW